LANQKYKFFLYKQQAPLYQFPDHPRQTRQPEDGGSRFLRNVTNFLAWQGKPKKGRHFNIYLLDMSVGSAVRKRYYM